MGEPVLMAMSGGVDSSVAAALLQEQGYEVLGVTMKLWGGASDSGCCSVSDVEDARRVADQLGIEHYVFNFGEEFDKHVVDPYVKAHSIGETPNPCVECNRHIKFDKLYQRADELGIEKVSTGHHARLAETDGKLWISRGEDAKKDQSYVLYMLNQAQLKRLLLPIGGMTKDEVRAHAERLDMRTAGKADSQDVCFIHSVGGRKKFLGERVELKSAVVVNDAGERLGDVESIELVTLGQRRGLNVGGNDTPKYVTKIDHHTQTVTLGAKEDLLVSEQKLADLVWADGETHGEMKFQTAAHGQVRSGSLNISGSDVSITWDAPQQRVASGQSVVFYHGDNVIGGALAAA